MFAVWAGLAICRGCLYENHVHTVGSPLVPDFPAPQYAWALMSKPIVDIAHGRQAMQSCATRPGRPCASAAGLRTAPELPRSYAQVWRGGAACTQGVKTFRKYAASRSLLQAGGYIVFNAGRSMTGQALLQLGSMLRLTCLAGPTQAQHGGGAVRMRLPQGVA